MDPNLLLRATAVSTKVIGCRNPEGAPMPFLGVRPRHEFVQFAGTPNPRTPLERGAAAIGFEYLPAGSGLSTDIHPDWTVALPAPGDYSVAYKGEEWFSNTISKAPTMWGDLVREAGWCAIVWQRSAGTEVHGQELLRDMDAGNTYALLARYVNR